MAWHECDCMNSRRNKLTKHSVRQSSYSSHEWALYSGVTQLEVSSLHLVHDIPHVWVWCQWFPASQALLRWVHGFRCLGSMLRNVDRTKQHNKHWSPCTKTMSEKVNSVIWVGVAYTPSIKCDRLGGMVTFRTERPSMLTSRRMCSGLREVQWIWKFFRAGSETVYTYETRAESALPTFPERLEM